MGKITVLDVDRDLGKAVLIWEGIECIFMAKITGGVQLVSKVYLYKDRLYEDVRIPKEVFRMAAAILEDKKKQRLKKRFAEEIEEQRRKKRAEQLSLF